jgi:adenine-specific DNA-methyltransferase
MNKVELEKKIKELEGLTNEEKSALVELLRKQKKYGLVWEDKPEDVEKRLQEELPVLTEVKERAIIRDE